MDPIDQHIVFCVLRINLLKTTVYTYFAKVHIVSQSFGAMWSCRGNPSFRLKTKFSDQFYSQVELLIKNLYSLRKDTEKKTIHMKLKVNIF